MISPRLSILMVAMSVVGTVAPLAASANDEENSAASIISTPIEQSVNQITGFNDQRNEAEQVQVAESNVEFETGDSERCGDCGSINVERADIGSIEQEQELEQSNELDTGDNEQDVEQDAENDLEEIVSV